MPNRIAFVHAGLPRAAARLSPRNRLSRRVLAHRGLAIEELALPGMSEDDHQQGWPAVFLANLDFTGYRAVVGFDEAGLLLRGSNVSVCLSRLPFAGPASETPRLSRSVRSLRERYLREALASGSRLLGGSGYLAGLVSDLADGFCSVLPLVDWSAQSVRTDPVRGTSPAPYLLFPDEVWPSNGWSLVASSLARFGSHGPSIVVLSDLIGGHQAELIRESLSEVSPSRFFWFGGRAASASRGVLFENALAVVSTTRHELFPDLALEAAQARTPLVSLPGSGCLGELISHGRTGFTCTSEADLVSVISHLLQNRSRVARLGSALASEIRLSLLKGPLSTEHAWQRLVP